MIYILSTKNAALIMRSLGNAPGKDAGNTAKNSWAEIRPGLPKGAELAAEDQVYLDISGLSPAEIKKGIAQLKKSAVFWGIIDPKGAVEDPALYFFGGAGDYIGPALVKKGLTKKRFSEALSGAAGKKDTVQAGKGIGSLDSKKMPKLPGGKFEGWKSIRPGTNEAFFFLFITLSKKINLRALFGDAAFDLIKKRLRDLFQQSLREADALLWMETENNSLFLVPPRAANCRAAIEAALKLIMNSRLIGLEKLNLPIPLEFTIALHYGKTTFQAPGKTGAVISESVNYIFHLGSKKAELGRLTMTEAVPEEAVPDGLKDLFQNAGVFEGIPVSHSRRFTLR